MTPTHSSADHVEWIAQARRQAERARSSAGSFDAAGSGASLAASMRPVLLGYDIRREVHRGGQGVVYEALQQSTGQTVALKVLREGPFAGGNDRQRFDREVSILATLNHRHIVRIIDRGAAAGSDYLVMDYVDGRPIDRYVREHDLSLRDRLRLFAEVCDAVSAAHQRGVIHRDLKPGNILIDSAGEPRVLDFGLAKTTADGDVVHATQTGQFIGSLPWASPEQSLGQHSDVDVRSDVYSLGVVLYQLLTGQFPYTTVGDLSEVLNRIRTAEPIRPRTIEREIDDDTETIVLKSLQKDPTRRYQSVGELARDVRHYLAREPIEAKRDSGWYLLRKSLYRHRAATSIAAAFVIVVTGAAIALSVLYARSRALVSELESSSLKVASEATKSQQVAGFAQQMLAGIDPATAGGMDKKLMRVVLDNAAKRVDTELTDQPEVEAAVRDTIGRAYMAIGELSSAQTHLARALELRQQQLGPEALESLASAEVMAELRREQNNDKDAEPLARSAYEGRRRLLGDDHPDTLRSMSLLAEVLEGQGRNEEAEKLNRATLDARRRVLGETDPDTLTSMNNLGQVLWSLNRRDEGERLMRESVEIQERTLGEEHPHTLRSLNNLAVMAAEAGRPEESLKLHERNLVIRRRVFGDGHPDTVNSIANLGELYRTVGRLEESERLLREAVASRRRIIGGDDQDVALYLASLASIAGARKDFPAAESAFREALAIYQRKLPADHWYIESAKFSLAVSIASQKRFAEAEPLLLESSERVLSKPEVAANWRPGIYSQLTRFYENWDVAEPGTGKREKAAEWAAKLEALRAATSAPAAASPP